MEPTSLDDPATSALPRRSQLAQFFAAWRWPGLGRLGVQRLGRPGVRAGRPDDPPRLYRGRAGALGLADRRLCRADARSDGYAAHPHLLYGDADLVGGGSGGVSLRSAAWSRSAPREALPRLASD